MRVKVSQAVPGCILLEDVNGKTGRSIITKQTTLTEKHLVVLEKFLIDHIYVSQQLYDGSPFTPHQPTENSNKSTEFYPTSLEKLKEGVHLFRQQFKTWEIQQKIDIAHLRQIMIPLFEQAKHFNMNELMNNRQLLLEDMFYSKQIFKSVLAIILAKLDKCEQGELNQIGFAGILSDSGMIKYDVNIYETSECLLINKHENIKHHPIYSYRLIENSPLVTKAAKMAVLQHHERLDGSGYPLKLSDEDIHYTAKIIAISDEFTEILTHYLTKAKNPIKKTIKKTILRMQHNHSNQLDQHLMSILITQLIENR